MKASKVSVVIPNRSKSKVIIHSNKWFNGVSKDDIDSSATLRCFMKQPNLLEEILAFIDKNLQDRERMCDLGCGYGFLSSIIGKSLGFKDVYGVDIDVKRLMVAKDRLNAVEKVDLELDMLPFPNNFFDLVCSFGVLEHLRFFDNSIKESCRVLKNGGLLLVSIPNLADWVNRLRLLLGLQPRNVQVSQYYGYGGIDHIHSCTLRMLEELSVKYGFTPLRSYGAKAVYRSKKILEILDIVFAKRPSLSIRFFLLARKISKGDGNAS
jgi:SAM-dependent methyltransferase